MPKVPLCEQCEDIVDEMREEYVDVTELMARADEVMIVHAKCYPEWKKVHVLG